jgi:hypothetical protein
MRIAVFVSLLFSLSICQAGEPIRIHPQSNKYFLFNDKPTVIITSGEHYGAVIHGKFDYAKYLKTLTDDGLNYTRIFTGSYVEPQGAFGIERNTIAPGEAFIAPWSRSDQPSYAGGGNKFDLNQWNQQYFDRLKAFLTEAAAKNVIVEITLFCATYSDQQWSVSPFNPANNTSGLKVEDWKALNTLSYEDINKIQRSLVEKIVTEVNAFDNVIFEIQNEPWADRSKTVDHINPYMIPKGQAAWPNSIDVPDAASIDWQHAVADWIVAAESNLPKKHLIAQNWCNFFDAVPHAAVSPHVQIVNFHYAFPSAVTLNTQLDKVIGYDETGFLGNDDNLYRRQAWRFMLSGGGLFNHLDYSFSAGLENGTDHQPNSPGAGSPNLRKQFGILAKWFNQMPFIDMKHLPTAAYCPGGKAWLMSNGKGIVAIYSEATQATTLEFDLPSGRYSMNKMQTNTGMSESNFIEHAGGKIALQIEADDAEVAWMVRKQ